MCGGGATSAPGSPKTNKPDNFCWQHCLKKEKKSCSADVSCCVYLGGFPSLMHGSYIKEGLSE